VYILQNDVLDYAFNGTNTWEGKPTVTNTAVLACMYPEICQIIAVADSGIATVADLAGKIVSIGDVGSGVETNAKQILAAYGLSTDDITVQNLGFGDSAEAMKNGTLDACFITSGLPNTAVLDLATSRDIIVVPVDGAEADALMAEYPFYAKASITPENYTFLTEAVNTIAVQATLICPADMDEDTAYNVVKNLFETQIVHEKASYLSPEYAVQGVSIDFHPGALKYYQEVGAL
jgi:TRAP transporter TAXI family solute receptor